MDKKVNTSDSKTKKVTKTKDNACGKGFTNLQVTTIAVATCLLSFFVGLLISKTTLFNGQDEIKQSPAISKFLEEYNKIKNEYYDDIDDSKTMKTALEAIIGSLDDYSTVVDDSLSNTLTTKLQGSYEGFGIEIMNDESNNIVVVNVIDDSPALEAGIKSGDIIKKVNDEVIENINTTDFVNMIKSSNSTDFNISVIRENNEINLNLKRKRVTLKSVASEIFEKNNKKIGYIYVSLFAYNTDVQFIEELKSLETKGIDSLIVDLRYNTGGHLTAVSNMMSEFLDKKHVIYQIESKEETKKYYSTNNNKRDYDMVVLVNGVSASASEMFAATMQEEYDATILGTTTFGKGTVQEVQTSDITNIEYKLTTKKWLTPKGKWINGKGVKPDIELEMNIADGSIVTNDNDNQLQEAINILSKTK